jgi:excisionase family DNA binding protein
MKFPRAFFAEPLSQKSEAIATPAEKEWPYFEPLINDRQAAELLGIHPKTLQRFARTSQIPAHRIGRFWRYRASELDAWLRHSAH